MLPESSIRRLCDELGIPFPPSNEDEIKQAYNKAVLRHHPDKGGTTERFGAIQDAKKFLLGYMQEMRQQQEREQEEREQEEKTRMRRQQERETQQEIKNIGRELEQMLQEMRKRPDLVSTFNKKFQDKYLAYVSKIQKFSGASFGDPAFGSQGASQPFGGGSVFGPRPDDGGFVFGGSSSVRGFGPQQQQSNPFGRGDSDMGQSQDAFGSTSFRSQEPPASTPGFGAGPSTSRYGGFGASSAPGFTMGSGEFRARTPQRGRRKVKVKRRNR